MGDDPVEGLARTCWGEARNQGRVGMAAVASVVLNRAKAPGWWGTDIVSVCKRKYQFSCWNRDDPNLAKLLAVTDADPQFCEALAVARLAYSGQLADPTGGATYYFESHIDPPIWVRAMTQTCQIGDHKFFRANSPSIVAVTKAPSQEAKANG